MLFKYFVIILDETKLKRKIKRSLPHRRWYMPLNKVVKKQERLMMAFLGEMFALNCYQFMYDQKKETNGSCLKDLR